MLRARKGQKRKKNFSWDVLFFGLYEDPWTVSNPPPKGASKIWNFIEDHHGISSKNRREKFEEAIWFESTCWKKRELRNLCFKIDWSEDKSVGKLPARLVICWINANLAYKVIDSLGFFMKKNSKHKFESECIFQPVILLDGSQFDERMNRRKEI